MEGENYMKKRGRVLILLITAALAIEPLQLVYAEPAVDNLTGTVSQETGAEIRDELAIKTADETEFTENMMEEDDSFELKEKKRIYFSKETEENAEENTDETAEDKAPTYDMRITFEDGTSADVHGIVLEDLRTLTIREKDGIVYGTYKLKSTKEKKTTYDTEKAIADQAAADAAAAQAAASQPAESYDSNDYSYDYSGEDYSGGDDYSGGEDGGDGCLDNGLLG